jgi:hypothetical protein
VSGLPPGVAAALVATDPGTVARRVIVAPAEVVARARAGRSGVLGLEGSLPPVAGHYTADGDALCFVPRFPFLPGTAYSVLVDPSLVDGHALGPREAEPDLDDYRVLRFAVAHPAGAATTSVVDIYPTAPTIPRNQLKLYVEFSAPMSEGEVARRVGIRLAATGEPIDAAFLPMEPELWDRARTRVTILFDPARIKRGLVPHEAIGYPLVDGQTVEVVVDAGFHDGDGRPLVETFTRRYTVGPDTRRRVDPNEWELAAPSAGTRAPLVVTFDRALDHALLQHCLTVVDADGRQVAGRARTAAAEVEWSFTPDTAWQAGRHELAVDPLLEDLAGNSVTRVFDRELARADHTPEPATRFARAFEVS